jgi:myo-inositol 2-dehydrogenase/D-chiro-inositol 1-dehydrogenase
MNAEGRGKPVGRREFIAGAAAAGVTVMRPSLVFGTQANSAISIGIIGCGGRGAWITDLFARSGKYRVAAVADYFQDKVDACGGKHGVPADQRFTSLSGYKRLLDTKVDAVVIETPPYFHPSQAAAAVEAGKHVYVAKPIAVDVPGCLTIEESGKKATKNNKVFLVDFQTRATDYYIEAHNRVCAGAIGKIIGGEARYLWDANVHDVPTPTPEDRVRFWYGTPALSGDVIVEQDIHSIDVMTWFMGAAPERAIGSCGRSVRKHGTINDHFNLLYGFPGGVVFPFSCQKGVPGMPDEIVCRIYGTEGMVDTRYGGDVHINGKHPYTGGNTAKIYEAGAVRNINDFHDAVTRCKVDNATVPPSVRSNLTCVLGRTAAYRRREVTWKEMIAEREVLEFDPRGLKS